MKAIHKTYKFRIQPTDEQAVLLARHFGCSRFVYNHFLAERSRYYLENKKGLNYYDNAASLTLLKKEKQWLKEVNSQALQATLKHLEGACNSFFRKQTEFPASDPSISNRRFGCRNSTACKTDGCTYPSSVRVLL